MYDAATRVRLVKSSLRQRRRRREKRTLCVLSALCLLLCVSLVGTIGALTGFGQPVALGMYGSILLHEGVGGYVLVGLLAFTAAVLLTVLCIRYRERNPKRRPKEEKKR